MYRKFSFGIGVLFLMLLPVFLFAQTNVNFTSCNSDISEGCYTLLEPLGEIEGIQVGGNEEQYQGIGGFINFVFEIGIGIGGVLGVVMLVIYGFQYATNEQSVAKFGEIRKRVTQVMLGLILLLGTFVLLRTINPDLLLIDPRISGVGFDISGITGGDTVYTGTPETLSASFRRFQDFASKNEIYCPGSGGRDAIPKITKSMIGKITYSMENRFSSGPSNTWHLDCSGFVHTVYQCAGLVSPGTYTGSIFNEKQVILGKDLKVGDLLGWVAGEEGEKYGHVVMYIGDGNTIEATSSNRGKSPGKGVQIHPLNYRLKRLNYIKPL